MNTARIPFRPFKIRVESQDDHYSTANKGSHDGYCRLRLSVSLYHASSQNFTRTLIFLASGYPHKIA